MAITDTAVHDIDTARWMLGEEIVAAAGPQAAQEQPRWRPGGPIAHRLETRVGALVDIETNVNIRYGYDIRGEVVGEQGAVSLAEIDAGRRPPRRVHSPVGSPQDWRERFIRAYDVEFQEWIDAIATGGGFGPSSWDGYAAAAVSDAAVRPCTTDPASTVEPWRQAAPSTADRRHSIVTSARGRDSHSQEGRVRVDTDSIDGGSGVVRFLSQQYSERDGVQQRLIPGCFGIFGHGNVAGVGQALLQAATTG